MASGSDDLNPIHKELSNITECSICKEVFTDPRSLPCLHTYCLKCIKQCNVNRKPKANADCPLCRNTFKIPADGLNSLPKNFLIDRMIQMKETLIGSAINQNDTSSSSSSSQSRSSVATDGVAEIIAELRRNITVDITNVSSNIERCDSILKQLSTDRSKFVDGVDRIASAVSSRVCQLKKKIVDDGQELLSNLNTLKDNRLKEVDSLNHNVEHQLTLLSSLKKEMDNLSQKGSAVEMVQKMTGLHDKAGELLKFDVGPSKLNNLGSVDIEFTYCETGDPALNMIGRIDMNRTARNDIARRPSQVYKATTSDSDTSSDSDVDQATSLYTASPRTGIVNQSMGGVQTSAVAKRAASSQASSSQATASKKPKTSVGGSSPSNSTLLRRASTESSESWTPGPSRTASRQSSMPTPRVIEPVDNYGAVDVTILNDLLFVLRNDEYGIAVFDTATFTFQRNIAITGVVVGDILSALTSSATNKCLYVGDKEYKRIHKIDLPSRKTTLAWEVHGEPTGLSVNKLSNLIVTCFLPKILEYTTRGSLVREISLAFEMYAMHTIQLTNAQFAVCDTRLGGTSAHRVWLVDGAGQFKASCGRTNPGTSSLSLNKPIRLAVDKNGLIFVADRDNNRIVVLNPDLSFVRVLPESVVGRLQGPCALHYDGSHDLLYVGERSGRVLMIDSISRHCRQ